MEKGGSLWVHKASHHFDLLNWWIESDPESVYALGDLSLREKRTFRADNCRSCPHTKECQFYFDITRDRRLMQLYVDNEKHDGYLRMDAFQERYQHIRQDGSDHQVHERSASVILTHYLLSVRGYRIAFNGTKGRMDAWIQESNATSDANYDQIVLYKNFGRREYIRSRKDRATAAG